MKRVRQSELPVEHIMTVHGVPYVNFRSTPSTEADNVISILTEGDQVAATTEVGEFTACKWGSKYGYVMTQYLK